MSVALPDLVVAIKAKLIESADLAALISNRIYLELPKGYTAPPYQNFILIEGGRGGQGDVGLGLQEERVDIKCYGTDRRLAYQIWRTLDYFLLQPDGRTTTSFTRALVEVLMITRESGPLRLVDKDLGDHQFTTAPYLFLHTGATS